MLSNNDKILESIITRSLALFKGKQVPNLKLFKDIVNNRPLLLKTMMWMEETGGEPSIVDLGLSYKGITIVDTSAESPIGRRSLCYDQAALEKRKANKPAGSAQGIAKEIGARLLTKEEYLALQKRILIDEKSSSWLLTPSSIREKGGAIYGERRFGEVFIGANGADSYFSNRGFRLILVIE